MTLEVSLDRGRPLHGGRPRSCHDGVGDHGPVPEPPPAPAPRPRGDEPAGMVPQQRRAPDGERGPVPAPTGRVYADGSALSRYLDGAPCGPQWLAWAADHESRLVTTPLSLTELRRVARPRGVEATGVAHDVQERVEVVRFSDQTLKAATKVSGVLAPFLALHLGAALAHPGVVAVATYDVELARVSALHGLDVVSPGWPARWWEQGG